MAGHFGKMVSVFFNQGDGTFEAPREHETGRYPNAVAIGDLNGDGAPDLATANQTNTVSVLANWGDGSFVARRDFRTGEDPWSIAIGDLNGDGKADLATASESSDAVSVLLNTTGLCTVPTVRAKRCPRRSGRSSTACAASAGSAARTRGSSPKAGCFPRARSLARCYLQVEGSAWS